MKNINNFTQWKKMDHMDVTFVVHTRDHASKAPHTVWAQYIECSGYFQYIQHIY